MAEARKKKAIRFLSWFRWKRNDHQAAKKKNEWNKNWFLQFSCFLFASIMRSLTIENRLIPYNFLNVSKTNMRQQRRANSKSKKNQIDKMERELEKKSCTIYSRKWTPAWARFFRVVVVHVHVWWCCSYFGLVYFESSRQHDYLCLLLLLLCA